MLNKDWYRWIEASTNKYLKQVSSALSIPALLEGVDTCTESFMLSPERAEIRIIGPFWNELSGLVIVNLNLSVLLTSAKASYAMAKVAGVYAEALSLPIGVWNYGSETGDYVAPDASTLVSLGCLLPVAGQSGKIINFGLVNPVLHLRQTEVETSYRMEIQV